MLQVYFNFHIYKGKSRGFGFVTLNNALSVKSILDIPEHNIDQKRVFIDLKKFRLTARRHFQNQQKLFQANLLLQHPIIKLKKFLLVDSIIM